MIKITTHFDISGIILLYKQAKFKRKLLIYTSVPLSQNMLETESKYANFPCHKYIK